MFLRCIFPGQRPCSYNAYALQNTVSYHVRNLTRFWLTELSRPTQWIPLTSEKSITERELERRRVSHLLTCTLWGSYDPFVAVLPLLALMTPCAFPSQTLRCTYALYDAQRVPALQSDATWSRQFKVPTVTTCLGCVSCACLCDVVPQWAGHAI